jgi:ketosteroid isomerase-like protein
MSEENVDLVRRAYAETTAHSASPAELIDADWEVDATDATPAYSEPIRGFEAADKALRDYWETFEDFQVELEEVIHADEKQVVTCVRDGGQIKGSGAEVWNRFFHVWTIEGRKIVRLSIHLTRSRALEAAGLSE